MENVKTRQQFPQNFDPKHEEDAVSKISQTDKRHRERSSGANKPEYQQGGPAGALFFTFFFTGLTYFNVEKCVSGKWGLLEIPSVPNNLSGILDYEGTVIVLGWFTLQCVLYILPVGGKLVGGLPLKDSGKRLKYRMNAVFVLIINLIGLVLAWCFRFRVTVVSAKLLQMLFSAVLCCFVVSILLYVKAGWVDEWRLNSNAKTGHWFYDWFMGRELNPRIGLLDLKYVLFRSGITGWMIMNFTNVIGAFESNGGYPSPNLVLLTAMQLLYVMDYFWFEEGILVSRDIVHEGLGYNLLIQFLMIPFSFCVQTRYLLLTDFVLPWYSLLAIAVINLTGYYIYRASNSEKNNFRKNPHDPSLLHLKTLETSSGKRLLISGWWGMCRHPNYLGDLIISFSYAFTTGFNHFLPYFNPVFLVLLLLDRERRDNTECKRKYGADWDVYCQRVKYRIIPYIY